MEFTKDHHTYKLSYKITPKPTIQEVTLRCLDKEIFNSNLGMFLYFMEGRKVEACELSGEQLQEL